jgi:hypothetical protein
MPSIQHLLETQFSVRMGTELTLPWLEERLELLRRYTLPSVVAQTTKRFTWLLLCDETTDPEILAELREEERQIDSLRIVLTGGAQPPLEAVRGTVRPDADILITTRLDSDDAIADDYLAAIQDYAGSFHRSQHETLLVNFPHGYRLDVHKWELYEDWMSNSSFHSLLERPRQYRPRTVRSEGHTNLFRRYAQYERLSILGTNNVGAAHVRLHQHYPTHQDESMRAWLIGVHGGNLINRIGSRVRKLPAGAQPIGFTLHAGSEEQRNPDGHL